MANHVTYPLSHVVTDLIDVTTEWTNESRSNITADDTPDYDPMPYIIRMRTWFFMMAVIIPVGLTFNTTAFIVFIRSSSLRKATTTHFLIALTFADSSYLIGEMLKWLNTTDPEWQYFGLLFIHTSTAWCQLHNFLRYFGQFFSAWLTVAITVERCLCVYFPLKIGQMSTKFTTRVIILTIFVLSIALNSYPFWVFRSVVHWYGPFCDKINQQQYDAWSWAIFRVGSLLLPSAIVFVCTALILIQLRQMALVRREMAAQRTVANGKPADRDEKQLIVMLLLVAVAFLVLRLPYNISVVLGEYYKDLFTAHIISDFVQRLWLFRAVASAIAALNYAINFFLFCFSGSVFRQKLYACMSCRAESGLSSRSSRTSRTTLYSRVSTKTSHNPKQNNV